MPNCITLADIDEALSCADLDNVSGVVSSVIYGYWDDVATWPDLPAPSSSSTSMDFATAGAWDGDVVMKSGTRAFKVNFTDETAELTLTDQGEAGAENVLYELSFSRSKMSEVIFGFENACRGRRMFLIVTDRNGKSYLMGDKLSAARKVAGDASTTGAKTTDNNRTNIKFQYVCPRKLIYTGDVEDLLTVANSGSGAG